MFAVGYDTAALAKDLRKLGISEGDTLFVHSSVRSVGETENGADTIIDALLSVLGNDGLLCCASHTWDAVGCTTDVYDPKTTPSCTGILSMVLQKREGAVRSLHPTHSMVVFGRDAEKFIEGEQYMHTPCPREGCCGKLLDRGAKVLFLGVGLTKNTFIHGVEEWNGIEPRVGTPAPIYIVMEDGSRFEAMFAGHKAPIPDVSQNYGKLLPVFRAKGIAREGKVGDAQSILCPCREMFEITSELLKKEHDLFLDDLPVKEELYGDR